MRSESEKSAENSTPALTILEIVNFVALILAANALSVFLLIEDEIQDNSKRKSR